jgi:hypothetical protein
LKPQARPITNQQLRYFAYSAFTSAKHGYLGKKNHIPWPLCIQNGIQDKFPEEDNNYVGFIGSTIEE